MGVTPVPRPGSLRPSAWHQCLNISICVVLAFVFFRYVRRGVTFFPITIETIWQIGLAEVNRRKSKSRTRRLRQQLASEDTEKGALAPARCLASVVGYREEPKLFTKCLESYKGCPGLETLLVGIDGNEAQDMEMANIVRKVFPQETIFIDLEEPMAHLAVRLAEGFVVREMKLSRSFELPADWTFDELPKDLREAATAFAMDQVYGKAAELLQKHKLLYADADCFRVICIYQPHISKKGIMFTNMIFATVLGQFNHIPYLFTSDSDTIVTPETIPLTVGCMDLDSAVGGSCSSLGIHNSNDTVISQLGCAIYWSELAITRGQPGAIDAVDCQPGPTAAFRLCALSPNLFDWYTQTSMGVKTIVNEDRHLTTKLLLDGWKVIFNTEAIAYTDTPTTLLRWLLQQIRWARASQIETFQYPAVYAIHGPILFLTAMNRFYGPLSVMVSVFRYVIHGDADRNYSLLDLLLRIFLCTAYNYISDKRHACSLAFLAFAQVFYQMPLPGIIVYASLTALEGGWGTAMRNRKETQKAKGAGWEHLRSVTVIACWMGVVAAAFARWLSSTYAPEWRLHLMVFSGLCTVTALCYALLRKTARA